MDTPVMESDVLAVNAACKCGKISFRPEDLASDPMPDPAKSSLELLAAEHVKRIDALFKKAVTRVVGPGWKLEDLRGRVHRVFGPKRDTETISLDGRVILILYPPEYKTKHDAMHVRCTVTQPYQIVV